MPKAVNPSVPLSGLFGLLKPSGPTSMSLLEQLKSLFRESALFVPDDAEREAFIEARRNGKVQVGRNKKFKNPVKIGQGGTLDPLADGVLVIGLNKGTKSLAKFLDSTKEYYTTALLGCETDTYDSDGAVVRTAPYTHVTRDSIVDALRSFRGDISQLPPIYSALKMDGKPLYEYARSGQPLPRPIEARKCTVESIELVDWREAASSLCSSDEKKILEGHRYRWPERRVEPENLAAMEGVRKLVAGASETTTNHIPTPQTIPEDVVGSPLVDGPSPPTPSLAPAPAIFTLRMTVSSGTYVRSIVHDVAHAVGSAAHVVSLSRSRQGDFRVGMGYYTECMGFAVVNPKEESYSEDEKDGISENDTHGGCIPWAVFEKAIKARESPDFGLKAGEGEMEEWENILLSKLHLP